MEITTEFTNAGQLEALLSQDEGLIETFTAITARHPGWFYSCIINFVTGLDLAPAQAEFHYGNILQHRHTMKKALGRDTGFRIATADYFINVCPSLTNPILLERGYLQKITHLSTVDPKTGCFNEKHFRRTAEAELRRSIRYSMQASIMLIDIDNFKTVNDTHGHMYGDAVLVEFSRTIKNCIRAEDIACRFGGDEFAVLMPITGRIGARCLAERLKFSLLEHMYGENIADASKKITFSGGIATFPHDGSNYEDLINHADRAMYASKALGKNQIQDLLSETYAKEAMIEERRRKERVCPERESTITVQNPTEDAMLSGKVRNLSRSGILFEAHVPDLHSILENDLIVKDILIDPDKIPGVYMHGHIVRLNHSGKNVSIAMEFDCPMPEYVWNKFTSLTRVIPA